MAQRIIDRYYVEGGMDCDASHAPDHGIVTPRPSQAEVELVVVANFVEVTLAKEGHTGRIGINYLEKIQTPTLPSLYGAMLAGVDYVLMGAASLVPSQAFWTVCGKVCRSSYPCTSSARVMTEFVSRFDPLSFGGGDIPPVESSKVSGDCCVDDPGDHVGTQIKRTRRWIYHRGPTAGGHNAPPRGKLPLNERGEPVYGPRDAVDMAAIAELGLPFWLAGSMDHPKKSAMRSSWVQPASGSVRLLPFARNLGFAATSSNWC
ncbi:MAG: hypothetical protein R3C56_34330 [Pirellulaceae bacterium]